MNKSKLIELIGAAVSVTGDIHFQDTGNSVLSLAQSGELNTPAICLLVIETNAISEVIFESYCLPFLVYKKSGSEQLLLSDFDGEVNFEKKSNAIALMLMVRAVQNVFECKPGQAAKPLNESEINARFAQYASRFKANDIVSSLERSDELVVELLQGQLNDMSASLSKVLGNIKRLAETDQEIPVSGYAFERPADAQVMEQLPDEPSMPDIYNGKEDTPAKAAEPSSVDPFKM